MTSKTARSDLRRTTVDLLVKRREKENDRPTDLQNIMIYLRQTRVEQHEKLKQYKNNIGDCLHRITSATICKCGGSNNNNNNNNNSNNSNLPT